MEMLNRAWSCSTSTPLLVGSNEVVDGLYPPIVWTCRITTYIINTSAQLSEVLIDLAFQVSFQAVLAFKIDAVLGREVNTNSGQMSY